MAEPFPKSKQLARGERRYRRKVASPAKWQAIVNAKCADVCRVCGAYVPAGSSARLDPHHLIPRDHFGDDVAENIIGLCRECHDRVTRLEAAPCRVLLSRLSDAEYAYAIGKLGEQVWERVYGVTYAR